MSGAREQGAVFSAARIAEIMAGEGGMVMRPTPEQAAVIEQPLGSSVLVIAGAGSGKTETMANRVVWLVANGIVEPHEVLGLTFTRKAAGELGERIAKRLKRFSAELDDADARGALTPHERDRAVQMREFMADGLDLPEVSTYNAFASGIVQEFGAMTGLATGAELIDGATAWGIARDIVRTSDDPELATRGESIGVLVKRAIDLDHAVSDNLTDFDSVLRAAAHLQFLGELPYSEKASQAGKRYAVITTVLDNMRGTAATVHLARAFSQEKRSRGLIEFSDQLSLAVETLRRSAEAVRVLRRRSPVVLLDEVQDTSVGQTALLSTIFAGSSVMAVGDPHQSIYGFRGASASNLSTFHQDFAAPGGARTLSLSCSWRNPTTVLAAANTVSRPLAERLASPNRGLTVAPLISRAQYAGTAEPVGPPPIEARFVESIGEEFDQLAGWMRDARQAHLRANGELPTAAVVSSRRLHMPAISEALTEAGVPNRIVGLGGLLSTPEVTDLVSCLRCLWYADADSDLIRVLAGPRFRIGVADLAGLAQVARWFAERDHTKRRLSQEDLDGGTVLPDLDQQFTMLDALDELVQIDDPEHSALRALSPEGRSRLREAGSMLRRLRYLVGGEISALLRAVEQALRLDIELDARELGGFDGSANARANLDAFAELVEGFLAIDTRGDLASVLSWLERAAEDDEVAEHVPEPEQGAVQLITVHGAKGLEWQLVAIPRLVDGEFPGASREGLGGLRPGQLPDELRGDAAARPSLNLDAVETQQEAKQAIETYAEALTLRHLDEERRLAYVAITRASERLLLTGSFWGGQQKPREPSVFLRELAAGGLIASLPESSSHTENPLLANARTLSWPLDPLGRRANAVLTAASAVREHEASGKVDAVVELLLAERAAADNSPSPGSGASRLPDRVNASSFHDFVEDPERAERQRLRPLPGRPYRRTRIGNRFHEWVERRATTALGTEIVLPGFELDEHAAEPVIDDFVGEMELRELIERFERSRWSDRQPVAVELEVTIPFAGRRLVCKLDAVYRTGEGEDAKYEVVDWKSGRPPRDDAERASRFLQLDLYRHAYAQWSGVDPANIDVTLFYVAEEVELRGQSQRSLAELESLWLAAAGDPSGLVVEV